MKKRFKKEKAFFSVMFIVTMIMSGCSGNSTEQNNSQPQVSEQTATPSEEPTTTEASADPMSDKGVGPVTSVEVGPLDKTLAEKGKNLFETKCAACHKLDSKYVGPALAGVTKRRTPEWVMNMMLNPVEMTQKDPIAKQLLEEHLTQMTFQDLTKDEARAIYEYFRAEDEKAK